MKKLLFALSLVLPTLLSCNSVFVVERNSYVQEYTEYSDQLEAYLVDSGQGLFDFTVSLRRSGRYANIRSKGEDKEWFDELCLQYGDVLYVNTQKVGYDWVYVFSPCCITPDITAVDVITQVDFDKNHLSGSSIADCLDVKFKSAYNFIRQGYPKSQEDAYTGIITKPLKDVRPEDLILLAGPESLFNFKFTTKPQDPQGTYPLTIICTDVNGRSITGYLDYYDVSLSRTTRTNR